MQITKLSVSSHFGENKRPGSGLVTFSDGKDYAFDWDLIDGAYTLSGLVRMGGRPIRRGIRSPKRVALLESRLNS
jgi:hypothetical protein